MDDRYSKRGELTARCRFYVALLHAQREALNIEPTRSHAMGFPYASAADCLDLYTPILHKHGLVLELASTALVDELELETKGGGLQWRTDLQCVFRLTHAASGHQQEYSINGRRTNDQDKGVQHAIASATKSMLLKLLMVSEERNEEGAGKGGAQASRGSNSKRRPQQRAPGAPTPPQNGTPPVNQASEEERIEFAQAQVREFMKKNKMKGYHLEAYMAVDPNIRAETVDKLDVTDWERVHATTTSYPSRFDEAMKHLAAEFPTAQERVKQLDSLVGKVKPPGTDQVLIEAAKVIGWCDAIEYWIVELERRDREGPA